MKLHPAFIFAFLLIASIQVFAQHAGLKSGPFPGNIELRNASVWMEVQPQVKSVFVEYYKKTDPSKRTRIAYNGQLGNEFNPVKFELNGLDINTEYAYEVIIDSIKVKSASAFKFTTKDLWQYRKPAADFSFLTGSCAYINEHQYDRPGRPYGFDSTIFLSMSKTPAQFALWLGDSWYNREVDYFTTWGLKYRVSRDRSQAVLQPLLAAMPHYFLWDDHDYGPNNGDKSYIFKDESRETFKSYTLNPSYGENNKGIYTKISYSDVDIFLTDNRYFRSHTAYPDSVNGLPNPKKTYFGEEQMEWLKNSLLNSKASFKIIASGSQVLNPVSNYDCMRFYSYEYLDLLSFIKNSSINGVIFLTGDRHHSEVIKLERPGTYPLYDITVSPFTAGIGYVKGNETDNPARIKGTLVELHNFGKVSVSGIKGTRKLQVEFLDKTGKLITSWSVLQNEISAPEKK